MKLIHLTQECFAKVSDEHYEWLCEYSWHVHKTDNLIYAATWINYRLCYMHRMIMGLDGEKVDHIDNDGLNNQKENLRLATTAQNNWNQRKLQSSTSKYKGVSWDATRNKWQVSICVNNIVHRIGRFDNELTAARAYDTAARHYFGEFARTNF